MAGRICFAGIYMTKGVPNLGRTNPRSKLGTPFSFLRCFPFCDRVLRTAPLDSGKLMRRSTGVSAPAEPGQRKPPTHSSGKLIRKPKLARRVQSTRNVPSAAMRRRLLKFLLWKLPNIRRSSVIPMAVR